jgi:hypothetical protein
MTNAWSAEKPKDICAAMRLTGMIKRKSEKTWFKATLI